MPWMPRGTGVAMLVSQWRWGPGKGQPGRSGGLKPPWSTVGQRSVRPQSWEKAAWMRGAWRLARKAGWRRRGDPDGVAGGVGVPGVGLGGVDGEEVVDGLGGEVALSGGDGVVKDDVAVFAPVGEVFGGEGGFGRAGGGGMTGRGEAGESGVEVSDAGGVE